METTLKTIINSSIIKAISQSLIYLIGMLPAALMILLSERIFVLLSATQWAILALSTVSILIFLLAYIRTLRKRLLAKPNMDNYEFEEVGGFFYNTINNTFHCSKCLHEVGNDRSVLICLFETGLVCSNCDKYYMSTTAYSSTRIKMNIRKERNLQSDKE